MEVDWQALTMSFRNGGNHIILKGDPTLLRAEVTLKRQARTWEAQDQGFLIEFRAITAQPEIQGVGEDIVPSRLMSSVEELIAEYRISNSFWPTSTTCH